MQYTANFNGWKHDNFQLKMSDIFPIFALNKDCGYTLQSPNYGGSNVYTHSMF